MFLNSIESDAIELLRANEPPEGYTLAYSGGKDSVVIRAVAARAGVRHECHYHPTTLDPPELVRFVRATPGVFIDQPRWSLLSLVKHEGILPTRFVRYCCRALKERMARGSVIVGVRSAESPRRARDWMPVQNTHRCTTICPILHWSDDDVWSYIRTNSLPYCDLYSEGFKRLGCIGCPLISRRKRESEFARWPRFERIWRRACAICHSAGRYQMNDLNTEESLWEWWMDGQPSNRTNESCGGSGYLFELENDEADL